MKQILYFTALLILVNTVEENEWLTTVVTSDADEEFLGIASVPGEDILTELHYAQLGSQDNGSISTESSGYVNDGDTSKTYESGAWRAERGIDIHPFDNYVTNNTKDDRKNGRVDNMKDVTTAFDKEVLKENVEDIDDTIIEHSQHVSSFQTLPTTQAEISASNESPNPRLKLEETERFTHYRQPQRPHHKHIKFHKKKGKSNYNKMMELLKKLSTPTDQHSDPLPNQIRYKQQVMKPREKLKRYVKKLVKKYKGNETKIGRMMPGMPVQPSVQPKQVITHEMLYPKFDHETLDDKVKSYVTEFHRTTRTKEHMTRTLTLPPHRDVVREYDDVINTIDDGPKVSTRDDHEYTIHGPKVHQGKFYSQKHFKKVTRTKDVDPSKANLVRDNAYIYYQTSKNPNIQREGPDNAYIHYQTSQNPNIEREGPVIPDPDHVTITAELLEKNKIDVENLVRRISETYILNNLTDIIMTKMFERYVDRKITTPPTEVFEVYLRK